MPIAYQRVVDGVVTKRFLECNDFPEDDVNEADGVERIHDWMDVANFVDRDEIVSLEDGVVLIF